jgi:hypothetical protein
MESIELILWPRGPLPVTRKLLRMSGLLPDPVNAVEKQFAYAASATLSYALLTGDDALVPPKLKAEAVLFRQENSLYRVLQEVEAEPDFRAARAFYLGHVAAVIGHARRHAPENCRRLLDQWASELPDQDGPGDDRLVS